MANLTLTTGAKRPYILSHIDGTPLKTGFSVGLFSGDNTQAQIVPDAVPAVAGALQTGFILGVKGASGLVGLVLTYNEFDANGNSVDQNTSAIDVVAGTPPPPPTSNLQLALGTEVPQ